MSRGSESTKRQREIARKFKREMEALGWVEFKVGDDARITLAKSKQAQEQQAANGEETTPAKGTVAR